MLKLSEQSNHTRYVLVFWLFVLSSVAFLDRTNIAIAGPQMSVEFGLSNQRLGSIFSAFLIGYAVLQIPAGWVAVRFGPRRVLALGTVWWSCATVLTTFLPPAVPHALVYLFALRLLLGVGESVTYPAANQFVARWIPTREHGFANGLIFAGVGAGSGLTPPFLNWLIRHHGWRAAFLFSAAAGLIIGAVWWLIARDRPEQHPRVSAAELQVIYGEQDQNRDLPSESRTGEAPPLEREGSPPQEKMPWRAFLQRPDLLALSAAYFCFGYVSWIYFSWFFLYLSRVRGVRTQASAWFTMLPFLSMTLCCLVGGLLNDRLTARHGLRAGRCGLAFVALLLTAGFLITGSHVRSATLAATILAGGAGALYLSQSSFWSVASDFAKEQSGVVAGVVNMGGQIGGATTAVLTPWIADHFGWSSSFSAAAFLAVLGACCWLWVHPERALHGTAPVQGQLEGVS